MSGRYVGAAAMAVPIIEGKVGHGTQVWYWSHIMKGAVVGKDCTIGKYVSIERNVRIGDRCKIQNHVSIYEGVTLEDEVFVGPSVVFTNDKMPEVANPKDPSQYVKTLVKSGASIGANATIVCGVTIGEGAMVGAGSVVTKDVAPHWLVYGNPAFPVRDLRRDPTR